MQAPLLGNNRSISAFHLCFLIFLQLAHEVQGGLLFEGVSAVTDALRQLGCVTFFQNRPHCDDDDPDDICPTIEPLGEGEFDLDNYTEHTWYIQKQQINPYQRRNDLYCVVATYEIENYNVRVYNYANGGAVNERISTPFRGGVFWLVARQLRGGRLRVGIGVREIQLPLGFGPYWVIAVDDDYEWAIVLGGQVDQIKQEEPKVLCTTKEDADYPFDSEGGLWLFSRAPIASEETINTMMDRLDELGIYSGDLIDVQQEGCLYEDARIK